ncbi:MAG: hypothetical protein HY687_06795 [Chloroflexi bacterium]|nr:hypothetical protein [Chloroflexota bacterium]
MSTNRHKRTLKEELPSSVFYGDRSGKNLERHILEGFLARLQLTSYGIEDGERPDFRITFGDGSVVVGCELTMFSADSPFDGQKGGSMERRLHSRWKAFATSLRSELDRKGLRYIYGALHFRSTSSDIFDQFDPKRLQMELVQICESLASTLGPSRTVDAFASEEYPTLNTFVRHVYLQNCYPETGILWWCGHLQSGEVGDPTEPLIQVIKAKAAKASSYAWNHAAQKWLLVYAASTGLRDLAFVRDNPDIAHKIASVPFDAVFLWNKFSEDITELYPHFRTVMRGDEKALYVNRIPSVIKPYLKNQ